MNTKKLNNLSGNDLSETSVLLNRLLDLIENGFSHVSDNINPSIIKSIKSDISAIDSEYDRREN